MNKRRNRLKTVVVDYLFLAGFSVLLYLLSRNISELPRGVDVWLKIVFGYWAVLIFILVQIGWEKVKVIVSNAGIFRIPAGSWICFARLYP